jgi:nitroreductase
MKNFEKVNNMNVKEAIEKRHSCRNYCEEEISEEIVLELLDAARRAPSGNNAQPCKYFLIRKKKLKEKLKQNNIFPQEFVYTAPLIIVCCVNPNKYPKKEKIDDGNEKRAFRDLGIATAQLILRATELELGSCYIGWLKKEELKKILNIDEKLLIPFVITIGKAKEKGSQNEKTKIEEIIIGNE